MIENDDFDALKRAYCAYVDNYRKEDGALPVMMQLKLTHTMMVVDNAKKIVRGENFNDDEASSAIAAALLHDTGRYEQLKLYNTFRDSESVDHAVFSYNIANEKGFVAGWLHEKEIMQAVLVHNRRELPPDMISPFAVKIAKVVRDADKLDIFRILEDQIKKTDWRTDARAFWNLKTAAAPNPEVVRSIMEKRPVDYQQIASLSDFVMIQVGWMINDLNFATSRKLCYERKHIEFRRVFLHELSNDESIDKVCDLAETVLSEVGNV